MGQGWLALALLLATLPDVAMACRGTSQTTYLHSELPELQADEMAAKVLIVSERPNSLQDILIEALIIQVLRGPYFGEKLSIKPFVITSCDVVPSKADSGIVVGRPIGEINGVLIVNPRRAKSKPEREGVID